jgi:uncharacterized OsmC-like protein
MMTNETNDRSNTADSARAAVSSQRAPSAQLNGLDTNALEAAVGAVARDPSLAPARFNAKTSWQGRLRSCTEISEYELGGTRITRRHTLYGDEPAELFGENSAPNPQDLLLAALNACLMVGFVVGATARGIELEELCIESSLALDLRGAFGVDPNVAPGAERVTYTIEVKGNASPEQFAEIHADVMARSPNRFHLATPLELDARLVVR